jgi:phenylpropionate dioxygenase-like ring-hydroxylating dioxygenase large terminal subunit
MNPASLVQAAQVHRDAYVDAGIFDLELQRLWPRVWVYVGHESLVPQAGDWLRVRLPGGEALLIRGVDAGLRLLYNRCAHRGAPVVSAECGRGAKALRCPYHGWAYRLDGSLLGVPLKADYEGSGFDACPAAQGLSPYGEVASHRGFVFTRASTQGPSLREFFGELLDAIDLIADRSPQGRLQMARPPLRSLVRANWKFYLDNINDAFHPPTTHASVSQAAQAVVDGGAVVTPAVRQLLPFASGHAFFEQIGARLLPGGHGILGLHGSVHSAAGGEGSEEYKSYVAAHGQARARAVLGFQPQNVVAWPSLALKSSPGVLRVLRPLAVNATLIEAWAFEPEGGSGDDLARAQRYNRQVFSPFSAIAHDDLHLFEGQQRALVAADAGPWISLHRAAGRPPTSEVSGTDEALLRHPWQAWAQWMAD